MTAKIKLLFSVTDSRLPAQGGADLLELGNKNPREPPNFTVVFSKQAVRAGEGKETPGRLWRVPKGLKPKTWPGAHTP